jgi:hypothetical protein
MFRQNETDSSGIATLGLFSGVYNVRAFLFIGWTEEWLMERGKSLGRE